MRTSRGTFGLLAATACALTATLGVAAPPAAAASSATTLYHQAWSTTKSWSVHYESASNTSNSPFLESGDAGPASGTQEVLTKSGSTTVNASIVVIGGLTYLRGNAGALQVMIGLTPAQATAADGKWFVFSTTNTAFSSIVAGVRSHDVAGEVAVQGPYSLGPSRMLDGLQVDSIYGTQKPPGLKRMRVVMYIKAAGSHQIVEEDTVDAKNKANGIEHIVFSKWGETVRPMAPSGAITLGPISTT